MTSKQMPGAGERNNLISYYRPDVGPDGEPPDASRDRRDHHGAVPDRYRRDVDRRL